MISVHIFFHSTLFCVTDDSVMGHPLTHSVRAFIVLQPTLNMQHFFSQIHAVAGPLGFFKGLGARVLYTMPATAICWSTYEFFKFMLSSQTHDDYRSTISGSRTTASDQTTEKKQKWSGANSAPDDALASAKSTSSLRYVISKPTVIATDIISESTTSTIHHSASAELNVSGPQYMTATTARELPSISSVGMYTAINMNSVHTDAGSRRAIWAHFDSAHTTHIIYSHTKHT